MAAVCISICYVICSFLAPIITILCALSAIVCIGVYMIETGDKPKDLPVKQRAAYDPEVAAPQSIEVNKKKAETK